MRVLIVEDEPALNRLLEKQLTAAHYSVDACLDGRDAQDYLACAQYDAVVLDTTELNFQESEAALLRIIRERGTL